VAGITKTINEGRNGVMPGWKEFLGEEKSHIVSAYVLSLSKQK
jgi:cytochrome c oxidase cbb3-type subunit 3